MPLLWLSLAFLGGLALASLLPLAGRGWLILGGAALSGLLLPRLDCWIVVNYPALLRRWVSWFSAPRLQGGLRTMHAVRRFHVLPLPVLLACLCLGGWRYQADQARYAVDSLRLYNDLEQFVVIEGALAAPPDERDGYANVIVEAQRLHLLGEMAFTSVEGRLLARLPDSAAWQIGDAIRLQGRLVTPGEDELFSYRAYLAQRGIFSLLENGQAWRLGGNSANPLQRGLAALRTTAARLAQRFYPDPEASLVSGILLGLDQGIPGSVQRAFINSGVAHIVAISGFNITLLIALFWGVFHSLAGRWRGALAVTVIISAYVLLAGAEPSAVRAALMGVVALFGQQIGRQSHGLNSLAFTAAVMAAFKPALLWDAGFQLSFFSTLGLVWLGTPLTTASAGWLAAHISSETTRRLAGALIEPILLTLAAQTATLPLTLYHFQRFSWVALLANVFILPAQPGLMVLSGVSLLAGLVLPGVGQALAYLAWPFAAYTIYLAEWFAALPGSSSALAPLRLPWLWAMYGLGAAAWLERSALGKVLSKVKEMWQPGLLALLFASLAALAWQTAASRPDGRLHLVMLDVSGAGQSGEAFLIQSPTGRYVLVNGGPSVTRLSDSLGRRLPLLARRLDWLVVAGVQESQLQALPDIIGAYPPAQVLWWGGTHASRASRRLYAGLIDLDIPLIPGELGQALDLGGGAMLQSIAAGPRGAVLLLSWQDFRALLPLGVDAQTFTALRNGQAVGEVSLLALAESGYAPANPAAWLANLHPQAVLLSVSAQDAGGLPGAETLQAIQGYTLLRTDLNGWVEVTTDGQQMWLRVQRP